MQFVGCYFKMKLRKNLKIVFGLFILIAVVFGLTSINHPILLKWILGTAKHIGKPIHTTVYTNGQVNNDIKVFFIDKYWGSNMEANNYLLNLTEYDSLGRLKFVNINLREKWIGMPVGSDNYDYDFIAGHLFQSETGGHFIPFQDKMKGFSFEPQLSFNNGQIKFNMPPNKLTFDSIRIEIK